MSEYRIVFVNQIPAPPASNVPDVPFREQIRNPIRQSIQDATRAREESRNMKFEIWSAERELRDAEQQLRNARTDDQRGAAKQALIGAREQLRALQEPRIAMHSVQGQPAALPRDVIPPQAVDISIAFFIMVAVILIGWPLARAMGRRLERRADAPALPDPAMSGQLQRIEQAVEAMSIEIERISESQRFLAKLQNGATPERSALGAGERR
ncbi:MAG: hypothetical protein LH467_14805 [Gemmatimonadaceae bacterium]|nr:hypothetical protein [Gemmatimonadaceae bacterium]